MATIKVPAGKEICYKCGGDGGEPGSNFGDYGFHPCFKCGTSGYLPAGTLEREEKAWEAEQEEIAKGQAAGNLNAHLLYPEE